MSEPKLVAIKKSQAILSLIDHGQISCIHENYTHQ